MIRFAFALATCAVLGASAQESRPTDGSRAPLTPLESYLSELEQMPPKAPAQRKDLGPVERWRVEACMQDAVKAPTDFGAREAVRLCKDKYNQ